MNNKTDNKTPNSNTKPANKNALSFMFKIKRGLTWSNRRVEIDRERFRYFKPDDNELRFSEKIDDCVVLEKYPEDPKKYYIILTSKTNSFKEVRIAAINDDVSQLKKFKEEIEKILLYKSTLANLQNKTFIIETEENKLNTELLIDQSVMGEASPDRRELFASMLLNNEDEISNYNFNKRMTDFTKDEELLFKRQSIVDTSQSLSNKIKFVDVIKEEKSSEPMMVIASKEKSVKNNSEIQPKEPASNLISEYIRDKDIEEPKIILTRNSIIDQDIESNARNEGIKWATLKFSRHSLIEYNSDSNYDSINKNLLSTIIACDQEFIHKQDLLKNQITTLKTSYNQIKENQIKTISLMIMICLLSLSLIFEENTIQIIIFTTVVSVILKLYSSLQKSEITDQSGTEIFYDIVKNIRNNNSNTQMIMKISSIFNENSKNLLSLLTNIKSYSEWNRYITAINNYNKEDNSASYYYMNDFTPYQESATEMKIKRKIIQGSSGKEIKSDTGNKNKSSCITIIEKAEVNGIKNLKTKVFIIEQAKNNTEKCKVSIFIPLKVIFDETNKIPLTYLKSAVDSLDLLHLYIENKNFNRDINTPVEDLNLIEEGFEIINSNYNNNNNQISVEANDVDNSSKYTKNKDFALMRTDTNNTNNSISFSNTLSGLNRNSLKESIYLDNVSNYQKMTNFTPKASNAFRLSNANLNDYPNFKNEFKEVDNKFSSHSTAEINYPTVNDNRPHENKTNDYPSLENTYNIPARHHDSLVAKPPPITDPVLLKENLEIQTLIDDKLGLLDQFLNKEWKILEEKADYKLFFYDEKDGFRSVKSECVIDKNIKILFDFLCDINKKNTYDKNFDCGHIIRDINPNLSLNYLKYKGKMMISPRDFTIVTYANYSEDECLILATSYNSEKYPKVKGVERADLIYGGYKLKRLEDFKTNFTFFSLSDLKLAQVLVNTSLKEVAMCAKYLKDTLK